MEKNWGGSKNETILETYLLENDELIVVGTTNSTDIKDFENNLELTSFILRFNKEGELIQQTNLNVKMLTVYSIRMIEDSVVVSGYSLNSDMEINGEQLGSSPFYIVINKEGNIKIDKVILGNKVVKMHYYFSNNDKIVVLCYSPADEILDFPDIKLTSKEMWLEYSYNYNLESINLLNGTATAIQQGNKGIVTPTPNEGYEVDKIIVKDTNDNLIETKLNEDGTYSFELYDDVTIEVLYKEILTNPKTGFNSAIDDILTICIVFL